MDSKEDCHWAGETKTRVCKCVATDTTHPPTHPTTPPISQQEQFQKVMRASILVGVHGAALTNMVWQPPLESTVIEIGFNPRKVGGWVGGWMGD